MNIALSFPQLFTRAQSVSLHRPLFEDYMCVSKPLSCVRLYTARIHIHNYKSVLPILIDSQHGRLATR